MPLAALALLSWLELGLGLGLAPEPAPASAPASASPDGADVPGAATGGAPEIQRPKGVEPPPASATPPAADEAPGGPPADEAPAAAADDVPAPTEVSPSPSPSQPPRAASTSAPLRASAPRRRGKPEPRYHRAPFSDATWASLLGEDVLMVLSTGYRVCATITGVDQDTVGYDDPSSGARKAARYMVTAVHEASWECAEDKGIPKVEWALPGSITGLSVAGLGLVFGVLQDAGVLKRASSYAILGFPTLAFGAPIVGVAGRSTARDLRVRGAPWARITGWGAFGGAAVATALWAIGYLGEVDALAKPGLSSAAGGLGLAGAGLLAFDALRSRRELREVRRLDAQPASASLRVGPLPLALGGRVYGLGVGVGGRF